MAVEQMEPDQRERPLPDLLRELSQELTTLVGKQVELAKVEISEKAKEAGQGAGMFGGAGLFGLLALGTLSAALILGLAEFLPAWISALAISAVYGVIAGILFSRGKAKVSKIAPPQQTIEAARDTAQEIGASWTKGRSSPAGGPG
jgi:uncharacterized membrane protein YqjE